MQNLIHGFGELGNGPAIAYLFGGSLIGVVLGAIPGLSGVVIISILLVFTYHMSLTGVLCLFLGAECGVFYSGSVSAILLNTPAHPEAFPITLDGYPMARNGQPGRALGISACSTAIGGILGAGVLVGFLQVIDYLPNLFHPPEFLALVTLSLLLVGTLGCDSVGKAIIAAGGGLMVASIGPALITGTYRYTFGATGLFSGISLVALALGIFAIPQMMMVFGTGTAYARQDMTGQEIDVVEHVRLSHGYGRELIGGILETFRYWGILLQGGIIGAITGMIPGIGGFTGNFLSYGIAKQTSRKRELYGTGIPEGIIAPEGSSLSKEMGHLIPIIGLGIPGGIIGALFLAALAIKGVSTGFGFQAAYPNLTGEMVWIMLLSGLIGTVTGVLIGPQIAKVTRTPGPLLVPFIFAMSISGPFLVDGNFFSVVEVLVFAVIGLGLRRLRYPLGSFIMGLVLGPTFETNVYQTHTIFPGSSFIAHRAFADVIFLMAILVLVSKSLELHNKSKKVKANFAEEIAGIDDKSLRAEAIREQHLRLAPYPLLAPIMSAFLLAVSLFFIIFGVARYNFETAIMPVIGAIAVAIPAGLFLPRDIYRYALYRKENARARRSPPVEDDQTLDSELVTVGVKRSSDGLTMGAASLADLVDTAETISEALTISPNISPVIRDRSWARHGQYRRELLAFGWLAGLLVLCWLVGFSYGTAIFMVCYGMTSTRRYLKKFHQRLLFAAPSAVVIWLITYEMFHLTHVILTPRLSF